MEVKVEDKDERIESPLSLNLDLRLFGIAYCGLGP